MRSEKKYFSLCFFKSNTNSLVNFLVSFYCGLGVGVFIMIHSIAAIYLRMIGPEVFYFSYNDALIRAIIWGCILFILIFIILNLNVQIKLKTISCAIIIMSVTVLAFSFIQGGLNVFNLIYPFALTLIVGMSYNLFDKYSKKVYYSNESLKLEHNEILRYIHILGWGIIIIIFSGVVSTLYPLTQQDLSPIGVGIALINHAILLFYYFIGFWFGIISQLIKRMREIREELTNRESNKKV